MAASVSKRNIVITAGGPGVIQAPTMDYDINGSNVSGWGPGYQNPIYAGSGMLFASGHQDINGRMIEACTGMHGRTNGNGSAGRWADFSANGAPTFGVFYPEGDVTLPPVVHDNAPSFYMPWMPNGGWISYWRFYTYGLDGTKIHGGTGAVYPQGTFGPENTFRIDNFGDPNAENVNMLWHNFNPATPINNTGNWTCFFGGAYGSNSRLGVPGTMKVVKSNPNYPSDPRPLWLQHVVMYGLPAPIRMRYAVILGDWLYWGGCEQCIDHSPADVNNPVPYEKFWRIHIPTLVNNSPPRVRQEECPPLPSVPNGYYAAIVCDVPRRRIIHLDYNGIQVLQVPVDDTTTAGMRWYGRFAPPNWTAAVTDLSGKYTGIRAVHRTEFGPAGQTFLLGNISSRFCRLRWRN
jgi:hypothetical protein